MERRKFVLSLGALAAGGGAAVGTGAFSSVEASRDFSVSVTGDASANLAIKPGNGKNGNYADTTSDGALAVDLTGSNSNVDDGIAGGQGINPNSVSTFGGVFRIVNQGTQTVDVTVTPLTFIKTNGGTFPNSLLVVVIAPAVLPTELDPGEGQSYSIVTTSVEADGEPDVSLSDDLQITAEETS